MTFQKAMQGQAESLVIMSMIYTFPVDIDNKGGRGGGEDVGGDKCVVDMMMTI